MVAPASVRLQVYVDDPLYSVRGTGATAARDLSLALLWALAAGFPLSWGKTTGGSTTEWIGARIVSGDQCATVEVAPKKCEELYQEACSLLADDAPVVARRRLRSFAGKASFVAGLVPGMRPFLGGLWAVTADRAPPPLCAKRPRSLRLPAHLVQLRRCRHSLRWLCAFFKIGLQGLIREHYYAAPPSQAFLSVSVDASPWGTGGILTEGGRPLRWFADPISSHDVRRFQAAIGDPAFNTLWEALAILVALRLWRTRQHVASTIEIRSDNLPSLLSIIKGTSRDPGLRLILCELSLDQAQLHHPVNLLTHIPGVSNVLPDSLSRLYSPFPHSIPPGLTGLPRDLPPSRNHRFYQSIHPHVPFQGSNKP